jgi:hypothetical protein
MSRRTVKKAFIPMTPGAHNCRIARIEENVIKKSAKFGDKPGVTFHFEDERTGEEIRATYTDTLSEASKLGKLVADLQGTPLVEGMDVELQDFLDRRVMIQVKHTPRLVDGKTKTYADVGAIIPLDLGTVKDADDPAYIPGCER